MELQGVMDFVKNFESSLQATPSSAASPAGGSSLKAIQNFIDSLSDGTCLFCDQADEMDKQVTMPVAELPKTTPKTTTFGIDENTSPLGKINAMLKDLGIDLEV